MSELLFLAAVLVIATSSTLIAFKTPDKAFKYFTTVEGKKVLAGIVIFVGLALGIVASAKVFAEEVKYFSYAEVFVGIDYTKNISPMCDAGGVDDRATSNGGFRLNLVETKKTTLNAKYTHHSCAFNSDNRSYDAVGLEVSYKFWAR